MMAHMPNIIDWRDPPISPDIAYRLASLSSALHDEANDRDRLGSAPTTEADLIRSSGLTALTVDDSFEFFARAPSRGEGVKERWRTALSVVRRLARVDLSAASLLGYSYMHLFRIETAGRGDVFRKAVQESVLSPRLWGGANNPQGPGATLKTVSGGYALSGRKNFATGAQTADWLVIGEKLHGLLGGEERLTFVLDARTKGISHSDDWDGIGARRSASGSILFDDVFVPEKAVFSTASPDPSQRTVNESIGSLAFQIMFVNLLVGAAQGSIETAVSYLRRRDRSRTGDTLDPSHVLEAVGVSVAQANAAASLGDRANEAFAALVSEFDNQTLTASRRGQLAHVISQAKIIADHTALEVTSKVFEATGARGATHKVGLDRFWRDVRTFTLHDPVAVKAQEVGAYELRGKLVTPSPNS